MADSRLDGKLHRPGRLPSPWIPVAKSPFHQRCACARRQRTDSSSLTHCFWGWTREVFPHVNWLRYAPLRKGGQWLPDLSPLHGQEPKADKEEVFFNGQTGREGPLQLLSASRPGSGIDSKLPRISRRTILCTGPLRWRRPGHGDHHRFLESRHVWDRARCVPRRGRRKGPEPCNPRRHLECTRARRIVWSDLRQSAV